MKGSETGERSPSRTGTIDTTRRHYQDLDDETGNRAHPVDELVCKMPDVVELDRLLATMTEAMTDPLARQSQARWTEYQDVRFRQRCLREERFYDVGYEMGRLAGLVEAAMTSTCAEAQEFERLLHGGLLGSSVARDHAVIVLLATAYALVVRPKDSPQATSPVRIEALSVPFSVEERERLEDLASEEGATVPEYVRFCVFGPRDDQDPACAVAMMEGRRIRPRDPEGDLG